MEERSRKIEGNMKEERLPAEVASVSRETEMSLEEEFARWRAFSSAIGMENGERRRSWNEGFGTQKEFSYGYGYGYGHREGRNKGSNVCAFFFLFIFWIFWGRERRKHEGGCHVEVLESTLFCVLR